MKDSATMIVILSIFILFNILYVLALVAISIPIDEEDIDEVEKATEVSIEKICNVTEITER